MDYDGLYDVTPQSADAFVETVYKSLTERSNEIQSFLSRS